MKEKENKNAAFLNNSEDSSKEEMQRRQEFLASVFRLYYMSIHFIPKEIYLYQIYLHVFMLVAPSSLTLIVLKS